MKSNGNRQEFSKIFPSEVPHGVNTHCSYSGIILVMKKDTFFCFLLLAKLVKIPGRFSFTLGDLFSGQAVRGLGGALSSPYFCPPVRAFLSFYFFSVISIFFFFPAQLVPLGKRSSLHSATFWTSRGHRCLPFSLAQRSGSTCLASNFRQLALSRFRPVYQQLQGDTCGEPTTSTSTASRLPLRDIQNFEKKRDFGRLEPNYVHLEFHTRSQGSSTFV